MSKNLHQQINKPHSKTDKPSTKKTTGSKNIKTANNKINKKPNKTTTKSKPLPSIKQNLPQEDIDIILSTVNPILQDESYQKTKSALSKHYIASCHQFNAQDFKILLNDNHRYRLLIKESLLITQRKPTLNTTERSIPLYIYIYIFRRNPTTQCTTTTKPN